MKTTLRFAAALTVAALALAPAAAQEKKDDAKAQADAMAAMASPKPSPEMERQAKLLVGTWKVAQKFEASEMGPASESTGVDTMKLGPGGLSIVSDYRSEGGAMGSFSGHGVTTWDEHEKVFKVFWVDSMTPGAMAMTGRWEGDSLVYTGEFTQMGKKYTMKQVMTDITPTSSTSTFDLSEEGGPMKRVMTFKYTKSS
jgi:hypothetical protein